MRVLHVGWGLQGFNFLPVPMEGAPGVSYPIAQMCNRKERGGGGLETLNIKNGGFDSLLQRSIYKI